MFNMSVPSRRASQKKHAPVQDADRRQPREKNSQLRPESVATNRSISPYRSLELWQTAAEFDLIDLGSPGGSFGGSTSHSHSRRAEDTSKRLSSELGIDIAESIPQARRSVSVLDH